jgi:hypothetical protein
MDEHRKQNMSAIEWTFCFLYLFLQCALVFLVTKKATQFRSDKEPGRERDGCIAFIVINPDHACNKKEALLLLALHDACMHEKLHTEIF